MKASEIKVKLESIIKDLNTTIAENGDVDMDWITNNEFNSAFYEDFGTITHSVGSREEHVNIHWNDKLMKTVSWDYWSIDL